MNPRTKRALVGCLLAVSLAATPGCASEEAEPETPAVGDEAPSDGGSSVAPGAAAEDAVEGINEKIEQSTEDPE